jgi:hypothetical protein
MSAESPPISYAVNVCFLPFTSKCAWCSNLTAPDLIIVTHGPKPTLEITSFKGGFSENQIANPE